MKKTLILLAVLAMVAPTFGAPLFSENFDGMGVMDGSGAQAAIANWTGDNNGVTTIAQNGGSTDSDWVNWGTPSVGAAGPYNQGMEGQSDRALGVYKTDNNENASITFDFSLASDVQGLEIVFDLEVPMARSAGSGQETMFNVLLDGGSVGSTGKLDDSNLTTWSWTDDSSHFWLSDAQMDASFNSIRGITMTTGAVAAGNHQLKWAVPLGGLFEKVHTGLDNVVISEVPEPATMTLLAVGGLGALIRRKRR